MKYDVTHICGHTKTYELYGPHKTRERKLEWLRDQDCLQCREAKLMQEITEYEAEQELPKLIGYENKVTWARKIRYKALQKLEQCMEEAEERIKRCQKDLEDESQADWAERNQSELNEHIVKMKKLDAIMELFLSMKEAEWWEDHQLDCEELYVSRLLKMAEKEKTKQEAFEEMKMACGEYRITPDNPNDEDDIQVMIEENVVWAKTPKDDTIIDVMHECHFKYSYSNSRWEHQIDEMTGTAEDRAAELMNHLLLKGYTVVCYNEEAHQKAIDGTYEEEHLRWILAPSNTDKLCIRIGYNDGTYEAWKKIGAKYDKPDMMINPKRKDDIEDIARQLGYKFTEAALRRLEEEADRQSHTTQVKEKLKDDKKVQTVIQDEEALLSELTDED